MLPGSTNDQNLNIIISSGFYDFSKIVILNMNLTSCDYKETFSAPLKATQFSEGIARIKNTIYQLTWQENQVLKWQIDNKGSDNSLKLQSTLPMPKNNHIREGWGLAPYKCDSPKRERCEQLIATDGSSQIHFVNLNKWQYIKSIDVKDNGKDVKWLNALCIIESKNKGDNIDQYVFANSLRYPFIYMIDLRTGKVVNKWGFDVLLAQQDDFARDIGDQAEEQLSDELV